MSWGLGCESLIVQTVIQCSQIFILEERTTPAHLWPVEITKCYYFGSFEGILIQVSFYTSMCQRVLSGLLCISENVKSGHLILHHCLTPCILMAQYVDTPWVVVHVHCALEFIRDPSSTSSTVLIWNFRVSKFLYNYIKSI